MTRRHVLRGSIVLLWSVAACSPDAPSPRADAPKATAQVPAPSGAPGAPLSAAPPDPEPEPTRPVPLPQEPALRFVHALGWELSTYGESPSYAAETLANPVWLMRDEVRKQVTIEQPWAAHRWVEAMASAWSSYFPTQTWCSAATSRCVRQNMNTLSKLAVGRRFYKGAGVIDLKTLKALKAKAMPKPDDPMLGATAAALYLIMKPHLRAHAWAYIAMLRARKRSRIMADFRSIKKRKRRLVSWFYRYGYKHFRDPETGEDSADDPIYGFWMRRMADGTDGFVFATALEFFASFDPAYHSKLAGAWKGIPPSHKR